VVVAVVQAAIAQTGLLFLCENATVTLKSQIYLEMLLAEATSHHASVLAIDLMADGLAFPV
jgi:hypothetical protein